MSDYWDVISFKTSKSGKTYAVRLGTAKRRDNGGFNLYLDAMPAPQDGQYALTIAEPRQQSGASQAPAKPSRHAAPDLDDEIPF